MKFFIATLLIACIFAVICTTPAEAKENSATETSMLGLSDQDRMAKDWMFSKVKQFCDHLSAGSAPSEIGSNTTPSTRILSNREMGIAECCFVSAKQVCNYLTMSASSNPGLARRDSVKPTILYSPLITPYLPPTYYPPPPSLFPPPTIVPPLSPPSLQSPRLHPGSGL